MVDKINSHGLTVWLNKKNTHYHDYQILSYKAVSEKKDILINAPTGTGKTLASLLAPIINFSEDVKSGSFTTLYISPLKSLIYDISRNLDEYLKAANLKISIETRTGDTSTYNKQKQLKKPPNFLITTPESFALMMSYDNSNVYFSNIKYIIIDELHRTLPIMSKYEKTRILGQRAKQLNSGNKPFISVPKNIMDGYLIAQEELRQKKLPFIIRRPLPNGGSEYWRIKDLEILY